MDKSIQVGRIGEINLLSASRWPGRSSAQSFNFWLLRLPPWMADAVHVLDLGRAFKRLNFLHTARFIEIGRFPDFGQPRESRWLRWMVFCGNFNQEWEPYFESFIDMLPEGVFTAWGNSWRYSGFPEPGSRNALLEWLDERLPATQHYYCAYPNASAHDVRAALRIDREVRSFVGNHDVTVAPIAELQALSARLQHCLTDRWAGAGPAAPEPVEEVAHGPEGCTGMSGFVALLPVAAGREEHVKNEVALLGEPHQSPFQTIPGTHFGKIAVIDPFIPYRGRSVKLESSWLLLSVDFDGTFDEREFSRRRVDEGEFRRYAGYLWHSIGLKDVWPNCVGYPGAEDGFATWLFRGVCKRYALYRDYPDRTLREVMYALETADGYRNALATDRSPDLTDVRAFLATRL